MPARLRINFFTPLPPLRTEVANHSTAVVEALGRVADVLVWTDQQSWSAPPGVGVRRFAAEALTPAEVNAADANVFNLGNNALFHKAIHEATLRVPGIVVLHDTNLQNFFAHYGTSTSDTAGYYLQAMGRWHGPEAEAAAREHVEGNRPIEALIPHYKLTLAAAQNAVALVVHNEGEWRDLLCRTRVPVYYVPLAFDLRRLPPERPEGPRQPPYRLVVFGFIGANRRIPSLLRALARSPVRDCFRVDIYGTIEDPAKMDRLITDLGLNAQLTQHGYVDPDVLEAALAEADLAVNLRNPTMGEASASQLRIWSHALPSLVSDVGWYATLPRDTVFLVHPDQEEAQIQAHLAQFCRDRKQFVAAGRRGRASLLTAHGTERYADALCRIVGEAAVQHGRRFALDLAYRTSEQLLGFVDHAGLRDASARVARRIAALAASADHNDRST